MMLPEEGYLLRIFIGESDRHDGKRDSGRTAACTLLRSSGCLRTCRLLLRW